MNAAKHRSLVPIILSAFICVHLRFLVFELCQAGENIANPEVRKRIAEYIDHLTTWAGTHRQWRKDK